MEYVPVETKAELVKLDEAEILEGYQDGYKNEPMPKGNRSQSYYHGWRNGMADGGHMPLDSSMHKLAKDIVSKPPVTTEGN